MKEEEEEDDGGDDEEDDSHDGNGCNEQKSLRFRSTTFSRLNVTVSWCQFQLCTIGSSSWLEVRTASGTVCYFLIISSTFRLNTLRRYAVRYDACTSIPIFYPATLLSSSRYADFYFCTFDDAAFEPEVLRWSSWTCNVLHWWEKCNLIAMIQNSRSCFPFFYIYVKGMWN